MRFPRRLQVQLSGLVVCRNSSALRSRHPRWATTWAAPASPLHIILTSCAMPPYRRKLLPSQLQYGEYFYKLLHQFGDLPRTHSQPLLLRRVVCSRLSCFAEGTAVPGERAAWATPGASVPVWLAGLGTAHAAAAPACSRHVAHSVACAAPRLTRRSAACSAMRRLAHQAGAARALRQPAGAGSAPRAACGLPAGAPGEAAGGEPARLFSRGEAASGCRADRKGGCESWQAGRLRGGQQACRAGCLQLQLLQRGPCLRAAQCWCLRRVRRKAALVC